VAFAVGGKQYIAVVIGSSLAASTDLRLTPEIKPGNTASVVVFALP
jgi:hypothetical protein